MNTIVSHPIKALRGKCLVPGDKSISHRALMLGALSVGETRISGLLEGADVLATADALVALGAHVNRLDDGSWKVFGCGVGGLAAPNDVIDMGNSGTGVRLLMGLMSGQPITAVLTGDASLRSRPMDRIMKPLKKMGVTFTSAEDGRLPVTITAPPELMPIIYEPPVASAQIKSAVLLAGLATPGETTIVENLPTRDHTERIFRHFGARIRIEDNADCGKVITVVGHAELKGQSVSVPADISSAAFPLVAALLASDAEVLIEGVGINEFRVGLLQTLAEMGADITKENTDDAEGEPVADLLVRASELKGVTVPADRAATMIDEYPILAMAAAVAKGPTRMTGLKELRVKESDRLALTAAGLQAAGVKVDETEDSLVVYGTGEKPAGGVTINAMDDHRIAMSFLVLGTACKAPIRVTHTETIATSFPGFQNSMNDIGTDMRSCSRNENEEDGA